MDTILPDIILINHRIYKLKIVEVNGIYLCFYYNKRKSKEYYLGKKIFRNEEINKVITEMWYFLTFNYDYKKFEI